MKNRKFSIIVLITCLSFSYSFGSAIQPIMLATAIDGGLDESDYFYIQQIKEKEEKEKQEKEEQNKKS